jgi:HEAT repeat protein
VRAAAAHSIALRNDPALEKELVPLLDDKNEEVRVRPAAGCLRLEWIKSTPPKPAPKQRRKKQASHGGDRRPKITLRSESEICSATASAA